MKKSCAPSADRPPAGNGHPRDLPDVFLVEPTGDEKIGQGRLTRLYQLLGFLREDQHIGDAWHSLTSSIAGFYSYDRILWVVTEDGDVDPGDFGPYQRR
ncbi:MAG: hypothetical protein F4052_00695 [Dehalococcoidia bacterium]|nr:hypothetical protein [Dehalococcoidia bacterium]